MVLYTTSSRIITAHENTTSWIFHRLCLTLISLMVNLCFCFLPTPCFKFILVLTDSISLLRVKIRNSKVQHSPWQHPGKVGGGGGVREGVGEDCSYHKGHIIKIILTAPLVRREPCLAHSLAQPWRRRLLPKVLRDEAWLWGCACVRLSLALEMWEC